MLKYGAYLGITIFLAGCSASEHFMQDDVYNTRTPIMPPGTDLNDITDYATYVVKKEQTEVPQERTTYVSPRQYYDYFYYSQYALYGYSPYSMMTGMGYYGYNNFYPMNYGYFGYGNPYAFGYSSSFGYSPYHSYYGSYYGYGGYYGPSYPYYNSFSYSSPKAKPNTGASLSRSSARVAGGRGSNMAPATFNKSQIVSNNGTARRERAEINSAMRGTSTSPVANTPGRTSPVNRTARPMVNNPSPGVNRGTESVRRPAINTDNNTRISRPTMNNSNNHAPTRTTSPTMRSGGSSGTPSSGGSRSGGRR